MVICPECTRYLLHILLAMFTLADTSKEVIEDLEPNYPVLSSAWSNMPSRSPAEMEYLWEAAMDIKASAQECQEERRDENAWSMNVARPMLEWETSSPGGPRMKPSFSRTECM